MSSSCRHGPDGSRRSSTIDLPQPRTADTREEPRFFELVTEVRDRLREGGLDEAATGPGEGELVGEETHVRRARRLAREWMPAAVVFLAAIVFWESAVRVFDVDDFLLPAPSDIVTTLRSDWDVLWSAAFFTFREALAGFVIGCGAGFLVAAAIARFRLLRTAIMPYAIAAGAIPIIAFAPITNNWFGVTGMSSKIAIAAILCFFPMLVNTIEGLTSVPAVGDRAHALLRGERARRSSAVCGCRPLCRTCSRG